MTTPAGNIRLRKFFLIFFGVLFIMIMTGCGSPKYKLILDNGGFSSKKTEYAEGEKVTVRYGAEYIGTDTDYAFSLDCDDVELKQDWDNKTGYIFTFRMPAHDVKISVSSRNSMYYDPDAIESDPVTSSVEGDYEDLHTDIWFCPECGQKNDMLYCRDCGLKKPE